VEPSNLSQALVETPTKARINKEIISSSNHPPEAKEAVVVVVASSEVSEISSTALLVVAGRARRMKIISTRYDLVVRFVK
jgi:hypothetical protein